MNPTHRSDPQQFQRQLAHARDQRNLWWAFDADCVQQDWQVWNPVVQQYPESDHLIRFLFDDCQVDNQVWFVHDRHPALAVLRDLVPDALAVVATATFYHNSVNWAAHHNFL
jgi:hypothetical protein